MKFVRSNLLRFCGNKENEWLKKCKIAFQFSSYVPRETKLNYYFLEITFPSKKKWVNGIFSSVNFPPKTGATLSKLVNNLKKLTLYCRVQNWASWCNYPLCSSKTVGCFVFWKQRRKFLSTIIFFVSFIIIKKILVISLWWQAVVN